MAGQMPTPLFQEWFGLNRILNSHFADKKVFFWGGGDSSFKDVVTRRGKSFLASSVILFSFCKSIHDLL